MCEATSGAADAAAFDADMTVYVAAGYKGDKGALRRVRALAVSASTAPDTQSALPVPLPSLQHTLVSMAPSAWSTPPLTQ